MDWKIKTVSDYLFLLIFVFESVCGEWKSTALRRHLLDGYEKYAPPEKDGEIDIVMNIRMLLRSMNNFNEVDGHVTVTVAFEFKWIDKRLSWNDSSITDVVFSSHEIWVPSIMLENSIDRARLMDPELSYVVLVRSKGLAEINFVDVVRCKCFPNVKYFPFDKHQCNVSVTTAEALYYPNRVTVHLLQHELLVPILKKNGQWHLSEGQPGESMVSEVKIVNFPIILERRPAFLIITLIIPIIFLCIVNAFVFVIPPGAGERTSFVIAVLLAFSVYMTIISEKVPNTSDPLPIYTVFLTINITYSATIALCSMMVVWLHEQNDNTNMPKWLKTFVVKLKKKKRKNSYRPSHCNGKDSSRSKSTSKNKIYANGSIPSHGTYRDILNNDNDGDVPTQIKMKEMLSYVHEARNKRGADEIFENNGETAFVSCKEAALIMDKLFFYIFMISILIEVIVAFIILALGTRA